MFKKHNQGRRSPNILFVIFRLILSMVIFAVLLGGVYSAYKHFSGLDPLKIDPGRLTPKEIIPLLSSLKVSEIKNNINQKVLGEKAKTVFQPTPSPVSSEAGQVPVFSFVLVSDSHSENNYLQKALVQAKAKNGDLKFIIGLGDYTGVGTVEELKAVKAELDNSGLRYFLAPGDHDLWDSRDKNMPANTNFRNIFGPSFQSFSYNNFYFIVLNNADNYIGFESEQLSWIELELEKARQEGSRAIYVFMHEPLYHPSSDHVMGAVNKDLKTQAKNLVRLLKDGGVKMVFFGHNHFFSKYLEPESNLAITAVGALTSRSNAQAQRYAVVTVFETGDLKIEDIEVQ